MVNCYKIFMRYVGTHFNSVEEMSGKHISESDKNVNLIQKNLNNL